MDLDAGVREPLCRIAQQDELQAARDKAAGAEGRAQAAKAAFEKIKVRSGCRFRHQAPNPEDWCQFPGVTCNAAGRISQDCNGVCVGPC